MFKLRPMRAIDGDSWGAHLGRLLLQKYDYAVFWLKTDRKALAALVHCLAVEWGIEPPHLHQLLESEGWEELSRLYFDQKWQPKAIDALRALSKTNMEVHGDGDYISILSCFYGYHVPGPVAHPEYASEGSGSLLSELTLKNQSPDSNEEPKQGSIKASDEENSL